MAATRVLYVEGDPHLAQPTMAFLEAHGLEVQLVPRSDLAIADIHHIRPDVVVLDLTAPRAGSTVADVCRALRKRYDAPIIVVSTDHDDEDAADSYLTKPFEVRDLLALILAATRSP